MDMHVRGIAERGPGRLCVSRGGPRLNNVHVTQVELSLLVIIHHTPMPVLDGDTVTVTGSSPMRDRMAAVKILRK